MHRLTRTRTCSFPSDVPSWPNAYVCKQITYTHTYVYVYIYIYIYIYILHTYLYLHASYTQVLFHEVSRLSVQDRRLRIAESVVLSRLLAPTSAFAFAFLGGEQCALRCQLFRRGLGVPGSRKQTKRLSPQPSKATYNNAPRPSNIP